MTVETVDLAPGYTISRIIMGGWQLSDGHGEIDRERAIAGMFDFVAQGIAAFDCADIYTGVEETYGEFLRRYERKFGPQAARAIKIHTKYVPDYDALSTLTKDQVRATVERSLRRLGRERLDLVQFSWWNYGVEGWLETMDWLNDLRQDGKIDLLGTTNFDSAHVASMAEAGAPIAANQLQYSVLDRRPDRFMADVCGAHGIKMLCYGTLAGGFLSERWLGQPEPAEPYANRSLRKFKLIIGEIGGWDALQDLLGVLRTVAGSHDASIANIAVRYILNKPHVGAAIVGARNADHLRNNLGVFALGLSGEDTRSIDEACARLTDLDGDVWDLERDRTGPHGRIMKYDLGVS